jgi:hypothetical protein
MIARIEVLAAILRTMPGNDCAAQRNRMLSAMAQFGSVTSYEGSRLLDCYDPRARIHELRQSGRNITTVMRAEQTESGVLHRVGVYVLDGDHHGAGGTA